MALLFGANVVYAQSATPCFQTLEQRQEAISEGSPTITVAPDLNPTGDPTDESWAFMTLLTRCFDDFADLTTEEIEDEGTYATVTIQNPFNGGAGFWRFPANAATHGDLLGSTDPCTESYFYVCNSTGGDVVFYQNLPFGF